jgi:citrate lyase subunit beta/citryl-CoA lyase
MTDDGPQVTRARRVVLCVPATHPDRVVKALGSGADEVVVDLEDAVPVGEKDRARDALADMDWRLARSGAVRLAVRVNAVGSPWCHRDLEAVVASGTPAGSVVVPKIEDRSDVGFVERLLTGLEAEAAAGRPPIRVQALVETAAGLTGLLSIVSRPDRLDALILGYADLAASLGSRTLAHADWAPAQHSLLVAARTAGVDAIDGPHLGVADDEVFRAEVRHASGLGFDGKWVIHPRQVDPVLSGLTPAAQAVEHADRVLEALDAAAREGRGAVQLDGQLIDEAMALAARRTLARAGR